MNIGASLNVFTVMLDYCFHVKKLKLNLIIFCIVDENTVKFGMQ